MPRGCQIFLICLLAFAVLVGAVCIVWPIVHPSAQTSSAAAETTSAKATTTAAAAETSAETTAAETTAAETTAETQTSAAAAKAQSMLESMSADEKLWQLFIATPESVTGVGTVVQAGDATKAALTEKPVGGLIYFSKNLRDRDQTIEMIKNSQSYVKIPLLVGVDEEGGTVSRVASNSAMGTTSFDSMATYGAAGDAAKVYDIGKTIGSELTALGFNLDFAPVADVVTNPKNTEIGSRSFSSDPAVAAKMVGSIVSGFKDAGILCTLKHFPGHGGTDTDSHNGLSVTTRTLDEMRQSELLPFQAGIDAGAPMVMVGHLSAEQLNDGADTPSDLSKTVVTSLLRGELGFDGVVVTDAQNMGAITDYYKPGEAAAKALEAGCDLVLMPADLQAAFDGVKAALESGELTQERVDESVLRVLTMKYDYGILS